MGSRGMFQACTTKEGVIEMEDKQNKTKREFNESSAWFVCGLMAGTSPGMIRCNFMHQKSAAPNNYLWEEETKGPNQRGCDF